MWTPSGDSSEDISEGNEAHKTLQKFLETVNEEYIETEYLVHNHPTNPSGIGYADIVFHGTSGDEVYETKPGSWSVPNTERYFIGINQRKEYIQGMKTTYENAYIGQNARPVNETGITLYPIIYGLVLPSVSNPEISIKYYVYPDLDMENGRLGMIYYEYGTKQKQTEREKAVEMAQEYLKKYMQLCEKEEDREAEQVFEWPTVDIDPELIWDSILAGGALAVTYIMEHGGLAALLAY